MTPIRTVTNTALPPITVGRLPGPIAITPDGNTAYVANTFSGTVTPIRTATNTAFPPIKVAEDPRAIGITPDGKTAYVVNYCTVPVGGYTETSYVTPIRLATNTALKAIKAGNGSVAVAITP